MKKGKKAEKLLLEQIVESAKLLKTSQKGLSIGELIRMIRSQLSISQKVVSIRSLVPQATLSKIESGKQQPTIGTLEKILDALECDLVITVVPRTSIEETRRKQAAKKAQQRVDYLKGTMSLEKQMPDQRLLGEVFEEELEKYMGSSSFVLWDEDSNF